MRNPNIGLVRLSETAYSQALQVLHQSSRVWSLNRQIITALTTDFTPGKSESSVFWPKKPLISPSQNFTFCSQYYSQGGGRLDRNPPIDSAIFHILGVFLASCTRIMKSRKRGCFHKSMTESGYGEVI